MGVSSRLDSLVATSVVMLKECDNIDNSSLKRMKELIAELNKASLAYYKYDKPMMSDKEYDDLYDELTDLEKEIDIVLAGSPTQKVQGYVLDGFKKVKHSKPMLSANKTKDIDEVKEFLGKNDFYCSYKLDGITLVVRYKDGNFVQGITRGNGTIGEDVTEQCRFIKNLPMKIPYTHDIEIRGECVVSWEEFYRINSQLEKPFSHPRNLAAGTIRNLDLDIVKERNLSFVAFEIVTSLFDYKLDGLKTLEEYGFECVGRSVGHVDACFKAMQPEFYKYPVDGLIFEINNSKISESLGATAHHECCRIALKWADDLYETTLRDIEWNTSRTGLINPVAIFDEVDLDGALTTRATLHNISYIEDLKLGIGDTISIYRSNMVIPKVHDNLTKSNTFKIPDKCPCCSGAVEVRNDNGSKFLYCTNDDCKAKLLGKLVHFCSRNAINIDGMSEATLEKFINLGWIKNFKDIFYLANHSDEMAKLDGFGKKSVQKLIDAIEKSRRTTFQQFLYSLSIPLIGRSAAKEVERAEIERLGASKCYRLICSNFLFDIKTGFDWTTINDFGDVMSKSLQDYCINHTSEIEELAHEFVFENDVKDGAIKEEMKDLSGKVFVITGSLNHFSNRDAVKTEIELRNGKVSSSVSKNTFSLINNDINSNSSKNQKAKSLGIPIITEEELLRML